MTFSDLFFSTVSLGSGSGSVSPNGIFYYHTNHLGSTAFVTDDNATVTQGFLYAPFGEIIDEYQGIVTNSALPKYFFNAKELDEETGMYYYEARYYAPPVFISRDPLMNEKPWLMPYHYCSNNPAGRVDPSGMLDEYTWVKTGDGRIVYNSAVHTDTDAEAAYGEGSECLPYGTYTFPNGSDVYLGENGNYVRDGKNCQVANGASFFKKIGNGIERLDNGGHADPANTGLITQQDVVVGCAVLGIMTGCAATIEAFTANKFLGGIVSAVGTLNAIDDAGTNVQGRSLSEQVAGGSNSALTAICVAKTAIDVANVVSGGYSISTKSSKTFEVMSTISSSVSSVNNAKKIKQ